MNVDSAPLPAFQNVSQEMKRDLISTETLRESVESEIKRLTVNGKLPRGALTQIALSFKMPKPSVRTIYHRKRHPQAYSASKRKASSFNGETFLRGGSETKSTLADSQAQAQAESEETILSAFLEGLKKPKVHDVHLFIYGYPEAYDRASLYEFDKLEENTNLENYAKTYYGYSIQIYHNGTIRVIIDASSQGGLDSEQLLDVLLSIGIDLYPITMHKLSYSEMWVKVLDLNVDMRVFPYTPRNMAVSTLAGCMMRFYQKKLKDGKDVTRGELTGNAKQVLDMAQIMNGGVNAVQRDQEKDQLLYMMIRDYRELKEEIKMLMKPSPSIPPNPFDKSVDGKADAERSQNTSKEYSQKQAYQMIAQDYHYTNEPEAKQSELKPSPLPTNRCPKLKHWYDQIFGCGTNFIVYGDNVAPEHAQLFEQCCVSNYQNCIIKELK